MDVGILIPLAEEFREFYTQIRESHECIQDEQTGRSYYLFDRESDDKERSYRCVVTFVGEMGLTESALLTRELIHRWNPPVVVMLGIGAGIHSDVKVGDVVVATQVDEYLETSKAQPSGEVPFEFNLSGKVYRPHVNLINILRSFEFAHSAHFAEWRSRCGAEMEQLASKDRKVLLKAKAIRDQAHMVHGHVASGPTVGAAQAFTDWLKGRDRKFLALEMEGGGFMTALYEGACDNRALLLRGISDYGDTRKADLDGIGGGALRRYAVRNAINLLWCLMDAVVFPHAEKEQEEEPPSTSISLAKLPVTSPDLFGREGELAILDEVWDDPSTNVITFVAFGGVGKTALVNSWLEAMRQDGFRGARRVYGWSFYSQGAAQDKQASGEMFIADALKWFGDPDPNQGSSWDKGARLARLVREQRALLILDGLEPLQHPPGEQGGKLRDPAVERLLRELTVDNPGLCVVSTRLPVDDLKGHVGTSVRKIDLERLSTEAGAEFLKKLGVKGPPKELEETAKEFAGHALALRLLGNYLRVVHEGDVRRRTDIPKLTADQEQGGHARRVMESYERMFAGKPELGILRMLGLFDRPAPGGAIKALRADPPIASLTDDLHRLSEANWKFALDHLRAVGLLGDPDPKDAGALDCHPLIREHFADRLSTQHPEAWREGHDRLYEYFKGPGCAKELPDTLDEMAPLYAAATHGCHAGQHRKAFVYVYLARIRGGDECYSAFKLGAFGTHLAVLSGFFDLPWRRPVEALRKRDKALLLNEAGFHLRAVGRLREAVEPMQAALDMVRTSRIRKGAAVITDNLSGLSLTLGDVSQAVAYAEQGVKHADQRGGASYRVSTRTTLAAALHQAGRSPEAEAAFRKAEGMLEGQEPEYPILHTVWGFWFCDLLLDQGRWENVCERAARTLEWARKHLRLLDIALDHLSLGRAHLMGARQEGSAGFAKAEHHLRQAVDGLRAAGHQEFLSRGLLARAEFCRVRGERERGDKREGEADSFELAERDLMEALEIAERGEMRLHQADAHLEYARLCLARVPRVARPPVPSSKPGTEDTGGQAEAVRQLPARNPERCGAFERRPKNRANAAAPLGQTPP